MEHDSHPLAFAAERGDIELVVALIRERGNAFDVNARAPLREGEFSLLHCALVSWVDGNRRTENRSNLVRLLCAHGANVNVVGKYQGGFACTPLHYCVHAEEAEILLDHGADIEVRDSLGFTPLMSCLYHNLPLVRLLVRRGADTGGWRIVNPLRVDRDVTDFLEGIDAAGSYAWLLYPSPSPRAS